MRIEELPQKQGTNLTDLPVPSTVLTENSSQKCVEQIYVCWHEINKLRAGIQTYCSLPMCWFFTGLAILSCIHPTIVPPRLPNRLQFSELTYRIKDLQNSWKNCKCTSLSLCCFTNEQQKALWSATIWIIWFPLWVSCQSESSKDGSGGQWGQSSREKPDWCWNSLDSTRF